MLDERSEYLTVDRNDRVVMFVTPIWIAIFMIIDILSENIFYYEYIYFPFHVYYFETSQGHIVILFYQKLKFEQACTIWKTMNYMCKPFSLANFHMLDYSNSSRRYIWPWWITRVDRHIHFDMLYNAIRNSIRSFIIFARLLRTLPN